MTEPTSESWSTRRRPLRSAKMLTISSVALPKDTFRMAASASLVWFAVCSRNAVAIACQRWDGGVGRRAER